MSSLVGHASGILSEESKQKGCELTIYQDSDGSPTIVNLKVFFVSILPRTLYGPSR